MKNKETSPNSKQFLNGDFVWYLGANCASGEIIGIDHAKNVILIDISKRLNHRIQAALYARPEDCYLLYRNGMTLDDLIYASIGQEDYEQNYRIEKEDE